MVHQRGTHAVPLATRQDVRVTDEVDIQLRLDSHHADQFPVDVDSPERDARGDIAEQLLVGHVGLMPSVGRNHAAIGFRGRVHDRQDRRDVFFIAAADVGLLLSSSTTP